MENMEKYGHRVSCTALTIIVFSGWLCKGLEIKIGLLLTENMCCDFKSVEDKASAINIGLDQLYADGILDNSSVTVR